MAEAMPLSKTFELRSNDSCEPISASENPAEAGFCFCAKALFAVREGLAAAACASALHASVTAAVACHDGSAGGAAWGVSHVDHGLHGCGGVVDAAIFDGEVVRCGLRVGGWVGWDSLLGWLGGVGFLE